MSSTTERPAAAAEAHTFFQFYVTKVELIDEHVAAIHFQSRVRLWTGWVTIANLRPVPVQTAVVGEYVLKASKLRLKVMGHEVALSDTIVLYKLENGGEGTILASELAKVADPIAQ